jgi:thiamine-monophosphate kinase
MPSKDDRPGEFDMIARFFAPFAAPGGLGLLDDAALLTPPPGEDIVLTKDCLVAGVHFFPDDPPDSIARKALRVNLSDLAAKGARPLGFLLGLGLPDGWREDWLAAFAAALAGDARRYHCPLYGGDTVRSPERLTLSITAFGAVAKGRMITRSGGRPGDQLYVSGIIGAAAMGLALRRADPPAWANGLPEATRAAALDAYLHPAPAMAMGANLAHSAHAAMDVSDGLVGDALKLARASGCGLVIDARKVPLLPGVVELARTHPDLLETCLTGGDDYQILAAFPPSAEAAQAGLAARDGYAIHPVGHLVPSGAGIIGPDGRAMRLTRVSFSHF